MTYTISAIYPCYSCSGAFYEPFLKAFHIRFCPSSLPGAASPSVLRLRRGLVYSFIGHRFGYSNGQEVSQCNHKRYPSRSPRKERAERLERGAQMGGRNLDGFPPRSEE